MARKDTKVSKAKRREAELRELIRLAVIIVQEMARAEAEQSARDLAAADLAHIQVSAQLGGFPARFGTRLFRRGMTPHGAAVLFRDAARLPVQ